MIYYFRVITSESDDFIFEFAINSKTLFSVLHTYIQKELGFDNTMITSFFITDENWNKEIEVTLIDMVDDDQHMVMDKVCLEDLIQQKKQRLLYAFDMFAERVLFMELTDIKQGPLDKPECLRLEGTPPPQFAGEEFDLAGDENFDDNDFYSSNDDDLDWDKDNSDKYYGDDSEESNYY